MKTFTRSLIFGFAVSLVVLCFLLPAANAREGGWWKSLYPNNAPGCDLTIKNPNDVIVLLSVNGDSFGYVNENSLMMGRIAPGRYLFRSETAGGNGEIRTMSALCDGRPVSWPIPKRRGEDVVEPESLRRRRDGIAKPASSPSDPAAASRAADHALKSSAPWIWQPQR